ncbi:MAG: hypothetical protein M5T61_03205 [Acidimicrobiia bacterium]|nr:hypothetical protein [Acidimicrobiia bacterium]
MTRTASSTILGLNTSITAHRVPGDNVCLVVDRRAVFQHEVPEPCDDGAGKELVVAQVTDRGAPTGIDLVARRRCAEPGVLV